MFFYCFNPQNSEKRRPSPSSGVGIFFFTFCPICLAVVRKSLIFASANRGRVFSVLFPGRLAQLVQSVCPTSRGSAVRIRQRPHLRSRCRICQWLLLLYPQSAHAPLFFCLFMKESSSISSRFNPAAHIKTALSITDWGGINTKICKIIESLYMTFVTSSVRVAGGIRTHDIQNHNLTL